MSLNICVLIQKPQQQVGKSRKQHMNMNHMAVTETIVITYNRKMVFHGGRRTKFCC